MIVIPEFVFKASGSGINLKVADTVINFEVPWNPAKKINVLAVSTGLASAANI